jgi:hypothetical protein
MRRPYHERLQHVSYYLHPPFVSIIQLRKHGVLTPFEYSNFLRIRAPMWRFYDKKWNHFRLIFYTKSAAYIHIPHALLTQKILERLNESGGCKTFMTVLQSLPSNYLKFMVRQMPSYMPYSRNSTLAVVHEVFMSENCKKNIYKLSVAARDKCELFY